MNEKILFDGVVLNYEKRRPGYGTQLFEDTIRYAGITNASAVIEVGCGTGQATEAFLKTNCSVTAVELGENLANYTRGKYANYSNLKVINSDFESYSCDDNFFDILYSATAFHWIEPEIGYKKAFRIIKNGGTLALFWNRPSINREDNLLHQKIKSLYNEFLPEWSHKRLVSGDTSRYSNIQNEISKFGFIDIQFKLYHNIRTMTGEEYIELLNTYSDHLTLNEEIRLPFFNAIKAAIEEMGNELIIDDTIDLYIARKP